MIEITDYGKKSELGWSGHRFKVGDYEIDTDLIAGHWCPEGEDVYFSLPNEERKFAYSYRTSDEVGAFISKRADELFKLGGYERSICYAQAEWEHLKTVLKLQ